MVDMLRRIGILFRARNKEFLRDRSALSWNILFPLFVIFGFSLLFSEDRQALYTVGVIHQEPESSYQLNSHALPPRAAEQYRNFKKTKYVDFIPLDAGEAMNKLMHHQVDLLINPESGKYWVSRTSPKGYIVERLLHASSGTGAAFEKESVTGREIPYIEWLFPGILGMNMMFSALFGVGYVVVRYRKNGVLKRMSVTPTRPFEFLTAQVLSRMYLLLVTTAIVYAGTVLLYGFECRGSYLSLLLVFALGGFSMVSLGLLVASRSSSEEFAGGILNLITWPMMFLSEVWFSLEGARPWIQKLSRIFPLTHMIDAARKIMNDGAGLLDLRIQIASMALMSLLFLGLGSYLFKWQKS